MNKETFLRELQNGLAGLPQDDIEERLAFYGEMIDDRMEEGFSESEAVAGVGSVSDIVSQTVAEIPITKLMKERVSPIRTLRGWEILLIILGFPVWFPLLIAFGAIILSLYIVLWALIISLWAVEISLWACVLGGLFLSALYYFRGYRLASTAMLGIGLFSAGLAILMYYGCIAASKGAVYLTKKMALGMKSWFIKKDGTK